MFFGLPQRLRSGEGALRFRRGASRCASLADLHCAFGMEFLRCCYHQVLGPRRHLPKVSNSFADTPVPASASTLILANKPLRAMPSAAVPLQFIVEWEVLAHCFLGAQRIDELASPPSHLVGLVTLLGSTARNRPGFWQASSVSSNANTRSIFIVALVSIESLFGQVHRYSITSSMERIGYPAR
jgi:hypothetical protein